MDKPIEISNLEDYIRQINNITHSEKTYLYRGHENEKWKVNSSAFRRLKGQYGRNYPSDLLFYLWQNYLLQIINEIKLRYPSTYRDLYPLECMAHLQHNRVATGLIDFTFNPLVALWFACASDNIQGKVIMLEHDTETIEEINTIGALQRELKSFFHVSQEQWYLWAPTLDNRTVDTERMTMQQSVFLFGLPEMDGELTIQEIIVPAEHKAKVRAELAIIGISEKTLFSDLLGFFERNSHVQPYNLTLVESNSEENHHG